MSFIPPQGLSDLGNFKGLKRQDIYKNRTRMADFLLPANLNLTILIAYHSQLSSFLADLVEEGLATVENVV